MSDNSACKRVQEGKKPFRSCYMCRCEGCPVWQEMKELAGLDGSAPGLPRNAPDTLIEGVQADAVVKP